MKTRKILAASTAALLSFASVAVVASAAAGDAGELAATVTDFTDVGDFEVGEWNDLGSNVQIKITKDAKKALADYAFGSTVGTAGDYSDAITYTGASAAAAGTVTIGGAFADVEKTSLTKFKKALGVPTWDANASGGAASVNPDSASKDLQFFDIAVGYNSDKDEVELDAISLKSNVTIRLTTAFEGKVYHLANDGKTIEAVDAKVTKKSDNSEYYYTFDANTFSPYFVSGLEIKGLTTMKTASSPADPDESSEADASSDGAAGDNANTGIALAIAPVVLAAGAVAVVALKKKH